MIFEFLSRVFKHITLKVYHDTFKCNQSFCIPVGHEKIMPLGNCRKVTSEIEINKIKGKSDQTRNFSVKPLYFINYKEFLDI